MANDPVDEWFSNIGDSPIAQLLRLYGKVCRYHLEPTMLETLEPPKDVMGKLNPHGVKLLLPYLLVAGTGFVENQNQLCEVARCYCYCAPRQLPSCLLGILPKLMEVFRDSNVKVHAAGPQALQIIGSVIRNLEIETIMPVFLEALQDRAKKTSACLATFLETKFVHFIDALSWLRSCPLCELSSDGLTEARKMAAQIIGNSM